MNRNSYSYGLSRFQLSGETIGEKCAKLSLKNCVCWKQQRSELHDPLKTIFNCNDNSHCYNKNGSNDGSWFIAQGESRNLWNVEIYHVGWCSNIIRLPTIKILTQHFVQIVITIRNILYGLRGSILFHKKIFHT
jgi:hypothetical protein